MENETLPLENENSTPEADLVSESATEVEIAPADPMPAAEEDGTSDSDFSDLAAKDLAVLRQAFPELSDMESAAELPEAERYGELREAGLTPIEAFCASHHKILTARRTDNRAHLSASIGRAAGIGGGRIGAAALSEARDLFPSLSDREIEGLYRRVTSAR